MKKILIIEDDPLIARVYGTKYASAGFETRHAPDGEAGLDLVQTFRPDLVHLDLMVPKVDGPEIITRIRGQAEFKALPIVVLTNTYQNRLVKAAMAAGATECVSKATCTPKMMVDLVEKLLLRRSQSTPEAPADSLKGRRKGDSAPPGEGRALNTGETQRHAAFQATIQADFLSRAPGLLTFLRDRVMALSRAEAEAERAPQLSELWRSTHSLAGHAGVAGLEELSQVSSALAALLKDLLDKPSELTPSSLQTIVDAFDFLASLLERGLDPVTRPALVLVVDDEVLSRRAVGMAVARLNVATISVDDPHTALKLAAENRFDLIFLDVGMPGMSGFELCKEIRALPLNRATPVVFVTGRADFQSRESSALSGGNDLIAKPFLPMELAVKALSLLRRNTSGAGGE